jgi:signal transduction histidine kinase/CheY-like chemotaxis protein
VSRGQLPVRIDPTMVAPLAGETSLVGAFGNDVTTVEGHLAISLGRNPTDDDRELLRLLTSLATSTLASLALMVNVREADVRLRQLVDATPVALIESTIEEDVVWSNPTAQSLLHWSSEQGTWPPALLEALRPLWANASDHTAAVELPPLDINGQSRLLNASVAALPDSPRVLTVLDDLTDQRALRDEVRLAQGLGIKGEVASAIAHDFNNLLTLVSGYCELLTPQLGDDQTARDLVGSIAATVVRAATLTAQLQSVGRPTTPDFTSLDINNAVRATADVLERVVGNDVTMTLSLEAAPATTRTNPDLFEQMLVNLAVNARDAMAGVGSLLIATDLETEDARGEGTYVRLRVSDSGCGMDETTLAKCFDPLFTTKGPLKGTGMGLAGVRRLVEESHGTVAVASTPGAGTTFTFRFPLVHVEPPVTPRREARRSATIAVVDDDDAVRQLMVQVLRRSGYEVLAFSSGVDALECPLLDQLDLLVSDVVMPELSGPELARRLMVSHPALPILLVSGTATPASLDGLSPLVTLLSKPFRPSLFMDEVNARLSERR